ncbi:MAG: Asp-tRNA(Asn)/Glu-tRNA(Gln) amidotransferase subunit GatB, partial [Verrucomicrobia bacterium]|nr:Asp-tRNA(Asn)/Glu-tRNA(Gln) amidotransferase subunit GatB [Verrucomicrobiota bacterium]
SGLMINATIPARSKFDRKSYFYPDMPKNYQISQFDQPLCEDGHVMIDVDGRPKRIRVKRIHLEEDVAKNMHFAQSSGVDFNRAGVPLMEIVSEPDLESPEEAFAYLIALKHMLAYAGVSECNLEEGNIRCDVNCSVRPDGQAQLGTKAEIKNLNTFKGVLHALKYEIERQCETLDAGGAIIQETRRWDADAGTTSSMRTKEDAHDYRYFPEPDLMPVVLTESQIAKWKAVLPEMPQARQARLVADYDLPDYDAGVLVADRHVADYFEAAAAQSTNAKAVSNWMMTEMLRLLSESERDIRSIPFKPESLATLVNLVEDKTVSATTAKSLFEQLFNNGGDPVALVQQGGLAQVSDSGELESFVDQAMAANPQSVADYRAGKKAAAQFLMGQVMRLSRGQANPKVVMDLLAKKLSA